ELQGRSGHGRPFVADAAGDLGVAALGRVDLANTVGARQQVVLRAFQADAAGELARRVGGVPGRRADDVRGERSARVLAGLTALERDLGELVVHRLRNAGVDELGQHDVALVRGDQRL